MEELVQVAPVQESAGGSVLPVCASAAADNAISKVPKQSALPDHQLLRRITPILYPDVHNFVSASAVFG